MKDLTHWRSERRIRIGYDGSNYGKPALQWTQSSFIQPQMMVQDRYLYDPVSGKYTVDRYLDDLQKRYGGIDAVLAWSTYPNMGIDDRNQQDMVRSMPRGVAGVQQSMRTPRVQARSAQWTWRETCGNGPTNSRMRIRGQEFYAEEATTSRKAQNGIFRRHIETMSTESCC